MERMSEHGSIVPSRDQLSFRTGNKDEDLVIGNEPCTFVSVRDVLSSCTSAGKLWQKLIEIARSLEIPADKLIVLKTQLATGMATHPDALFEILETWRAKSAANAKLNTLINVLDTNELIDCADTLRIHYKVFDDAYVTAKLKELKLDENLPEHFTSWMNMKIVKYQRNQVKLGELTHQIKIPVDKTILKELAAGTTPCIVNDLVPEKLDYYINRTVTSRYVLKTDVLCEPCNDVFVVEGMEKYQLSLLVPENESTDVSGNQLLKLTVRFILLRHKPDFDKICKLASTPVHWIRHMNGKLKLVMSHGSVEKLQKYVDDPQDSFFEEELASSIEKAVVIADSPGMGKTCLLANIAHQIMVEYPFVLVRFIVLKEFLDALSMQTQKINVECIVKLIAEQSSVFEFGRKLVENALKTQTCVLLFDGLDEVLPNQMTTARQILKAAATLPSSRVFVATRPHFRDDVENTLQVFAYTIQPFDESNQVTFLLKFWKLKGATANDSLTQFTSKCVHQLSSKLTKSERNIAGIPLQCRLIAETYEEQAIRCSKLEFQEHEGADSVIIVNSMFGIYERHMDMQFDKIRKQKPLLTTRLYSALETRNQYEIIKHAHMYFALELLFPEHAAKFQTLNSSSLQLSELCGLGILEATHSNDIRFVHRTFAEFLIAWLAHENKSPHRDLLLSTILKLTQEDVVLNNPFQMHIMIPINSFKFDFPVICYFSNGFSKQPAQNEPTIDYHDEALPYYYASAYENYESIPHVVTRSVTSLNPTLTKQLNTQDLFYVTARYSGVELMKKFCSHIDISQTNFKLIEESDKSGAFIITPLHLAVERGHYNLVEYLIKKLKDKTSQLLYLLHFCVKGSVFDSAAIIQDKMQIIKLLSKRNKKWIDEELPNHTTPIMQESLHTELLECLIREGANLDSFDEFGNTLLHKITTKNKFTGESYHRVLSTLDQHGFLHFNKPNNQLITPLHIAVERVELLSNTLDLFVQKHADLNSLDIAGDSVLFYAIRGKRSLEFISQLVNLEGAETNHRNWKGQNVLHFSAEFEHFNALKYFIETHDMNVNEKDMSRNTPLHFAVVESKDESMQLFLLQAGANVNAENEFHNTPFMDAFVLGEGLSLPVIKEMEKHGLDITESVASKALTYAFLEIETDQDTEVSIDVLMYLIEKHGRVGFEFIDNFWKWDVVKDRMSTIIKHTQITSQLLAEAKEHGVLTQELLMELETADDSIKSKLFYEMVQEKSNTFERVYIILKRNQANLALEELRECLRSALQKLQDNLFVTPHPGVNHLLDLKNSTFVAALTEDDELSIRRILDTVGKPVEIIEEHELEEASMRKLDELVVLKCDTVTPKLIKNLQNLNCKVVCVCKHVDDGVPRGEIVLDNHTWTDISSKYAEKLWFSVDANRYNATDLELFATPGIVTALGKHAEEFSKLKDDDPFRLLRCKMGHLVVKQDTKYLSSKVFNYFLPDKLVFININEDDLRKYTKYGQKIGRIEKTMQSLNHAFDYMILPQTVSHLLKKILRQTNSSVHLIDYNQGKFILLRTWGSQENLAKFFEPTTQFCTFPLCDCPTSDDMFIQPLFKNSEGNELTFEMNVNELLPKGRRVFGLQSGIDLYELRTLVQHLRQGDQMPSENSLVISQLKEITTTSQLERCGHHIIELVYELVKHLHFPERDKNFQQVALNTLFPHLAKIIQPQPEFELEKCMEMGLLEYKNDWLVFKHDVLATYIIAELIVHQDFESLSYENVLDLMFSNCFDAHLDESSFNSWNKVSCYTKPILSYRFAKTNLFKFLDLFAKTSEHVDAVSKLLTKVLPSQNIYKWIYATVNDNLVNLLKIILFKLEEDDKKCFKSEDLVVLAVNNGDVSLVDLVLKEYKKETKKDIINIKIPLLNFDYQFQRFISILNVAALKSKSSVLEYLLKLQPDNMQDLLYFCVVDTHEQNDVDERKHIITTLVGNYPSLLQKDSQLNKSPLLAPNLHVDLIIHLISLSVNVHAVDANDKNVLHLCPQYLTPQEYEHIVKELVKTQKTHIFHSRDKWQNTPLHYAVQHLELLDSTFELFSSANIDYDDVDEDNNTALMFAVKFNRSARLLDSLINAGSDDKARGQHNRTLLHFAVEFGNFNALTYFLSRGHDVNAIDKYGDNPLHLAQKLPQKTVHEIILTLVQHGVNVHANNDDKQTAVSTTNNPQKTGYQSRTKKQGVQVQIYKSIGELESTIRKWGSEIIRSNIDKLTAMTNCDSDFLQTLTSREILTELDAEELTSKRNDSSNANKLYNLLLTKEYDFKILLNVLNESNNTGAVSILTKEYITTLYNAVMNRKYAFVYYASKTAGFYSVFEHLLQTLEEGDRDEYAEKLSLVESMCSINPQLLASQHVEVYSPLHVALGSHNEQQMKLIQLLISHNADVNQRDIRGFTPLHSVVSQKIFSPHVIKIVKLLIENGADPDALNEQRLTFLNLAPGFLTPELYHELVEFLNSSGRKDSIKMLDYQNYSNLHHALLFMEPLPETLNIFKMNGIDFNGQDIQGNSLMFSAIAGGSKAEFLKTLLENGADWKITNIEQDNVIHIAAFYGNLSAVKLFISLGCDVNAKSKVSRTPLHNVLLAKKLSPSKSLPHTHEIVVELVEHGANVNAIYEQQTPLDIANDSQIKLKTKEFLKRHGAQCYKNIVKMLMEPMIRKWQTEVIRNNMSKLSTITNCNISLLQKLTSTGILTELEIDELVGSCGTSDFSIANKLYTVLLTKDYDFKILLNVLHEANQMEALRILIKDLISFIYDSVMNRKCPLVYYILNTKGYFDVLQTLMQKFEKLEKECVEKFNIVQFIRTLNPEFVASNSEMYSPLQLALMSSHYEQQMQLIQLLVAHKADVNEKDIRDFTSLHYAVGQENVSPHVIEIIKLLIENGADPDSVDKQGRTFLHWAPHYLSPELYDQLIVYFDSSGWVKSLNMLDSRNFSHLHHVVGTFEPLLSTLNVFKSNGIDFNGQDIDGDSVVFDAIEGGRNAKFLKVLFNYGADWKIQNSKQENALHLAALHGNVSALKLFISLGSDVNAKNTCGHTPLHNAFLAKKHGKYITTEHEIVVLLMNEHVDITAKDEDGKTPIDLARERHQTGNVLQETLEVLHNSRSSERNSFLVNNSRKEMLASMISDDETLD